MTTPVDSDDQVKEALRIPISEEFVGTFEAIEFSIRAGSKASRSSV